ncbi:hypothetical protein ACTMU2_40795 [Cupriavidus basilensis]
MLCINVFALAIGTVVVGAATDYLIAKGVTVPLTRVLLTTDALAISSALFFALARARVAQAAGHRHAIAANDEVRNHDATPKTTSRRPCGPGHQRRSGHGRRPVDTDRRGKILKSRLGEQFGDHLPGQRPL